MEDDAPLKDEKLSKRLLMGLPNGVFIVSGIGESPWEPTFAEDAAPIDQREEQWQRIVQARVNHRMCMVFKDRSDYKSWCARIPISFNDKRYVRH
jgi:hypothetical protein